MTMLLVAAAICLSISVLAVTNLATLPARNRRARIRSAATYGNVKVTGGPERLRFSERVIAPLVASLSRTMLRLTPKQNLESIAALLMSAGMRTTSPQAFLASKAAAATLGLVFGLMVGSASSGGYALLFGLGLGAIGYVVPGVIVNGRARRRSAQLVAALPDALDLLAVSVEAGLGFDAAIAKLTQHMKGPLSDEFELALGEMRIGESRVDALKKLSARANTPEIASFVRSIIQADQLGTSLGRILRVQAVDSRNKRQAAAEERAMKAPIKMLFPTVLFIFPAMFIVVLGPAMLSLGKLFGF
jgi:tight adherence protein C